MNHHELLPDGKPHHRLLGHNPRPLSWSSRPEMDSQKQVGDSQKSYNQKTEEQ